MRLSSRAIELCRLKFGKGAFCGFDPSDGSILGDISEEDAGRDFDALAQSGLVGLVNDEVHITALGHHILNMLLIPEQYIMLDCEATRTCVRLYFRNAYYLCVIEDKKVESDDSYDRYTVELLPRLDLVVGAFVYALHQNKTGESARDEGGAGGRKVSVVGRAWDQDRNQVSELVAEGEIGQDETVRCRLSEETGGAGEEPETIECETSELVNRITKWLFGRLSAASAATTVYESEA